LLYDVHILDVVNETVTEVCRKCMKLHPL